MSAILPSAGAWAQYNEAARVARRYVHNGSYRRIHFAIISKYAHPVVSIFESLSEKRHNECCQPDHIPVWVILYV